MSCICITEEAWSAGKPQRLHPISQQTKCLTRSEAADIFISIKSLLVQVEVAHFGNGIQNDIQQNYFHQVLAFFFALPFLAIQPWPVLWRYADFEI